MMMNKALEKTIRSTSAVVPYRLLRTHNYYRLSYYRISSSLTVSLKHGSGAVNEIGEVEHNERHGVVLRV
jgi:hypothetical protein